jgi:hypothetical protein
MILAAPLVIPFAEAVGISIATLGMAKGADMVNDYIQKNPEESAMILKTLVPNLGIGEIFMNKEKISLEDLEEMTDEEAQDLSKEEKAELMKQGGKSKSKDKRQTMIDLSEKLGLSGEGREQQDIEYEVDERYDEGGVEDAPKPKFDYKKFFRNRRADGGAIRKNFSNGGDSDKNTREFQNKYIQAAIKLASDKNIGIGDAMMITSDEDFDIDNMEYKGSSKGILEILNQKADGGAIGIEVLFEEKKPRKDFNIGGRATTQDFANALKSVSAGTTYQQQAQAKEYARNEAANELRAAIQGGGIDSFLQGAGLSNYRSMFTDTRPGTNRQGAFTGTYNVRKEQLLNDLMNKKLQPTSYAPKPKPKTYRTVSPEAQALNMSQSTYEDIIRSGADPKQYYMDYQNRIMAGNPNLLKYGQVIGGPGMGIAGPGTAPGATPPTQAQMNQMMQNNPMGYMDFADLVKTYSADPYKGLQEEIKDVVGGRDTGYMSGQDYYDINVLGLDGRGIAEKYGLEYADGGRVGLFMGGPALEGQALNIYNSMNSYGFTDQQIADALQGQGLYTPSGSTPPETTTPNIIGSQINQGGGGDNNFGGQGIGAFGNLDPNTKQTMQVEVADGKGGVEIKEVDTYLDAGGMRKTLDNKNPVNAGIDIKPMAVGIIEALMGKKNDSEFDPAGKIYGTFNNPNYKDLSFFGKIKADYSRQKELKQLQKEFELQEKLKEQIRQEAIANANKPYSGPTFYNTRDDGSRGSAISQDFQNTTASLDNYSADVLRAKGGMVGYKDGGLATMFTRKR